MVVSVLQPAGCIVKRGLNAGLAFEIVAVGLASAWARQTGIGDVPMKAPRVRDRERRTEVQLEDSAGLLTAHARSVEELLPWLCLKGLSTGDFSTALATPLGKDAPGLSAATSP